MFGLFVHVTFHWNFRLRPISTLEQIVCNPSSSSSIYLVQVAFNLSVCHETDWLINIWFVWWCVNTFWPLPCLFAVTQTASNALWLISWEISSSPLEKWNFDFWMGNIVSLSHFLYGSFEGLIKSVYCLSAFYVFTFAYFSHTFFLKAAASVVKLLNFSIYRMVIITNEGSQIILYGTCLTSWRVQKFTGKPTFSSSW